MYGYYPGHWGMGVLMLLAQLAMWGAIALTVVWALRGWPDRRASLRSHPRRTPEEVLAMRFARGEIDQQEYAERTEALKRR